VRYVTEEQVGKKEVPAGCSGEAAAPDAESGFLCIFEGPFSAPVGGAESTLVGKVGSVEIGASKTGALLLITSKATESRFVGSWAVRG
jgi:hypothetical protein